MDLEDAMLSLEESDKQQASGKEKTEEEEGYRKVYTKTHEKRAEQSREKGAGREVQKTGGRNERGSGSSRQNGSKPGQTNN